MPSTITSFRIFQLSPIPRCLRKQEANPKVNYPPAPRKNQITNKQVVKLSPAPPLTSVATCSLPGPGASIGSCTLHTSTLCCVAHRHLTAFVQVSHPTLVSQPVGGGAPQDRMGCYREKANSVWALGPSLQHFRHNCCLPSLGFVFCMFQITSFPRPRTGSPPFLAS